MFVGAKQWRLILYLGKGNRKKESRYSEDRKNRKKDMIDEIKGRARKKEERKEKEKQNEKNRRLQDRNIKKRKREQEK